MRTDIMMMLCSDTYKHTHPRMYPKNLNKLVSYLTVRKNMSEAFDKMVFAGLQPFMKEYLVKGFNEQEDIQDIINLGFKIYPEQLEKIL